MGLGLSAATCEFPLPRPRARGSRGSAETWREAHRALCTRRGRSSSPDPGPCCLEDSSPSSHCPPEASWVLWGPWKAGHVPRGGGMRGRRRPWGRLRRLRPGLPTTFPLADDGERAALRGEPSAAGAAPPAAPRLPAAGEWGARRAARSPGWGCGRPLRPAGRITSLRAFPGRCRTRSRSPSSPTPVPCRRCCRSSRGCRPCRPRPPGWCPGEGARRRAARPRLLLPLLSAPPSAPLRRVPTSRSLPAASAPSGWPGRPHPRQAAARGPRPRPPLPRRPRPPHLLQLGRPVRSSSSSCNR